MLGGLAADRFECRAAVTAGRLRRSLLPAEHRVDLWPRRFNADFPAAHAVRRYLRDQDIGLIHTWGVQAAVSAAAAATAGGIPVVIELFDPDLSDRQANMLRSIQWAPGLGIACSTETIRLRLIEKGIEPGLCTVIRPGVDFATINTARRSDLRARLNLTPTDRVLITPEPASRRGGHFAAYWTAGVRSYLEPRLRLIIPGQSREQARIAYLAEGSGLSGFLRCPGDAFRFEELIAIADALLFPAAGDVPTTAIAWAMAAGVPVLAAAVYATAEMLADRHNALLVGPDRPKRVALNMVNLLDDPEELRKVSETARGQAYRIFGLRRCVDQHARLYDNALNGRTPGEGIVDSSLET